MITVILNNKPSTVDNDFILFLLSASPAQKWEPDARVGGRPKSPPFCGMPMPLNYQGIGGDNDYLVVRKDMMMVLELLKKWL